MSIQPRLHMPTRQPLLVAALLLLIPLGALGQQDAADTTRLVEHLQIQSGMRVAEVGAGTGSLTVAIAKAVGSAGHVFSNEIDPKRHQAIRTAVEQAGLSNVTIVESGASDANLPADCCEAIFMRNVYHHFDDPAAMNASLYRALRPGGRIAIIDFQPRGGAEATSAAARDQDKTHGVTPQSIERELRAAGFDLLMAEQQGGDRWFMVVARKPAQ